MTEFVSKYFFLKRPDHEALPYLQPNAETASLNFRFEKVLSRTQPLVFFNGMSDVQMERLITPLKPVPDVLFSGTDLLVRGHIHQKLLAADIPNLIPQVSAYVDEKGTWHEDFWYLTFTDRFDCWDREKSDYRSKPLRIGSVELYTVYKYHLNRDLLARTPLKNQLLFKMGAVNPAPVTVHESLVALFDAVSEHALQLISVDS